MYVITVNMCHWLPFESIEGEKNYFVKYKNNLERDRHLSGFE